MMATRKCGWTESREGFAYWNWIPTNLGRPFYFEKELFVCVLRLGLGENARKEKKKEELHDRRLDMIKKVRTRKVKLDDRCGARKAFTMLFVHRYAAINDLALHPSGQRAVTIARDNCLATIAASAACASTRNLL